MMKNVGDIDRTLRIVAGIVALGLGWYLKSWWGLIGIPLLLTGLIRWCPAYLPFKLSTRADKPAPH